MAEISQQRANADIANVDRRLFNESLRYAIDTSRDSLESITVAESRLVRQAMDAELIQFENVHYQYRLGLIDEEQMAVQRKLLWLLLRQPIERAKWENVRDGGNWTQSFVDEVDSILSEFDVAE